MCRTPFLGAIARLSLTRARAVRLSITREEASASRREPHPQASQTLTSKDSNSRTLPHLT